MCAVEFDLAVEQVALRDKVRSFVEKEVVPLARHGDRTGEFPWANWERLKEMGLLGLLAPVEYGGQGRDSLSYATVVEEISRGCAALGVSYSVHASLVCRTIMRVGTGEQKEKYLRRLASGDSIGAFALTEPGAGTDPSSLETAAVRDGDTYSLTGTKCLITNGEIADVFIVFAMTDRSKGHRGISAFLVEKGTPGFAVGKRFDKMGIRASVTNELLFSACRVPAANLLGAEGDGFKIAMATLDGGRIGIGAQAVGIAQAAFEAAVGYAKERRQFGQPISSFQAIQWMVAEMATSIEAARLLVYRAAALADRDVRFSKEAAMAKLFASDTAVSVTRKAVQVFGGHGYITDNPVERYYRDAKITEIYEGTSEAQKMVVAGAIFK